MAAKFQLSIVEIDGWTLDEILDANEFLDADEDSKAIVHAAEREARRNSKNRNVLEGRTASEADTSADTKKLLEATRQLSEDVHDPVAFADMMRALGLPEDGDGEIK